jgi:peptidoglycan/xylan/chitin deacetylase (PgdA/CDA1 family)
LLPGRSWLFVYGPERILGRDGHTCFLSFDDNYHSWLRTLPILEKHRVRATFYVNWWSFRDRVSATDARHYIERCGLRNAASEQETTLSTAELREIAAAGHTIGAHTHTHPVLTTLSPEGAREEIRVCREILGSLLDRPPEHFAYPFSMRR